MTPETPEKKVEENSEIEATELKVETPTTKHPPEEKGVINAEVSERYLLSTYEKERTEVLKGKEMIEINILQNNSLQGVFSSLESDSSGFVKPDRINYLRIVGNRVVSR